MRNEIKYTKAELIAKKVMEESGLEAPTEIPISDVIFGRGAYYSEEPLFGKDGEIVSFNNKSTIKVDLGIPFETRKRFAAAHELGHFEMHRHLQPIFTDSEEELMSWYQTGSHEGEANEFAAEYLMPSELFYLECKGKKFSPAVIEHLSKCFQVSKTASILRFVNKGNYPVFVIYCKNNQMKWFKRSNDFNHYSLFDRDSSPPAGTVAHEIFSKGQGYYGEEAKQQVWKGDWFKLKDNEDKLFYEYCLYVKSYNYTLSIIWED